MIRVAEVGYVLVFCPDHEIEYLIDADGVGGTNGQHGRQTLALSRCGSFGTEQAEAGTVM
jgi:hypothetical protein